MPIIRKFSTLIHSLLSTQRHYDWGLRALKTVLRHAGTLIHNSADNHQSPRTIDVESELLINALKINTLSKLTFSDSIRFQSLLSDVFPSVVVNDVSHHQLNQAIVQVLNHMKLQLIPTQIRKIIQLYESLNQRMGVVLVGPSGCGKTTCLTVLHKTLQLLGQSCTKHVMNPKSIDRSQLLGYMNVDTREWNDGILTSAARTVIRESNESNQSVHSWIVCDGDVDPEWIESLNSVLDDNHLLTLPNGERLQFTQSVNFIFETIDLQYASPATVSRMGMIYMSAEDIDIKLIVAAWVQQQPIKYQSIIQQLLDTYLYSALQHVQAIDTVVPNTHVGVVRSALTHLNNVENKQQFVIGLIRGLSLNMNSSNQSKITSKIYEMCGEKCIDAKQPHNIYYNAQSMDYAVYTNRDQSIEASELSLSQPAVVHTIDLQRYSSYTQTCIVDSTRPVLIVGQAGSGKSLILNHAISSLKSVICTTMHCSAESNTSHIKQKLYEIMGGSSTIRPKNGRQYGIIVLKNINLPQPDRYNTVQLHSFVHQLFTYSGFYDDNNEWISVENLRIIGTMNVRNSTALSDRLCGNMNIINVEYTDKQQLGYIISSYVTAILHSNTRLYDSSMTQTSNTQKLVGAIIELYDKLKSQFNTITQYTPRHLTELMCSVLRYDLGTQSIVDVIVWEAKRIFSDQLPNNQLKKSFFNTLTSCFSSFRVDTVQSDIYYTSLTSPFNDNYAQTITNTVGTQLLQISSTQYRTLIEDAIMTYERDYCALNMTIHSTLLSYISSMERVLSRSNGSLLLLGDTGVGRKTTLRLLSHILHMTMYTPNVTALYTDKLWRNDVKLIIKECGVDNKKCILVVEDQQMMLDTMIQDLNSLLSCGEITGLYNTAELDTMLLPLKDAHSAYKQINKNISLMQYFIHRIQSNLHIVLCMNPAHSLYNKHISSNPAFISNTTTLNFAGWSNDTITTITNNNLQSLYNVKLHDGTNIDSAHIQRILLQIYQSLPGTAPIKYTQLLVCYQRLFNSHRATIQQQRNRLLAGLEKLNNAAATVDSLSRDAGKKQNDAMLKQSEADHALDEITERMKRVSEQKNEVTTLQSTLAGEESKLIERKSAIEHELSGVQPILQQAKDAVGGIKKDNLNEIRSLRAPPTHIRNVLCGVLTLMKQDDLSWENMRKFLGLSTVKEDIINYDAKKLDKSTRSKVQSILTQYADSFDARTIARVNVACAPLAAWVKSVCTYSEVLDSVRPLQDEFDSANNKLNGARNRVLECEREVVELDEQVNTLKVKFASTTGEAAILKDELNKIQLTLNNAQSLLDKLSGERNRWSDQCTTLANSLNTIIYSAILGAAAVTLLPAQSEDIRAQLLEQWKLLCNQPTFDIQSFLSSETQILTHRANGLPSDNLSTHNALSILHTVQVPLIVDSNGSATEWLRNTLMSQANTVVEYTTYTDERFSNTVELAVRFGKTLVIHSIDCIQPYLYPLIRSNFFKNGSRYSVQLGGRLVDYNESFKLYLTSRSSAIKLNVNDIANINVINFTVTTSGLQNQLLAITLQHDRPELEAEKSKLLASEDELRHRLSELENELLGELAGSQGNLLENVNLVDSLNQTKSQSNEALAALEKSSAIQHDLDAQRDVYRPLAIIGAKLYFLLTQLPTVNNMYTFSLQSFTRLFNSNIQIQTQPNGVSRIDQLQRTLILNVFNDINRSLFKADRLMFGMHFVHELYPQYCSNIEWQLLIGQLMNTDNSGDNNDKLSNNKISVPSWIPSIAHKQYTKLQLYVPSLMSQCRFDDRSLWQSWYESSRPEQQLPINTLTPIQHLLIVSTLRADRAVSCMQSYICNALKIDTLNPPSLDINQLIQHAPNTSPVLFICEGGLDPTIDIEQLAHKYHINKLHQIALGTGQTDLALLTLQQCIESGEWLLLKNCHLVIDWLSKLQHVISNMSTPHNKFRVWLTTECHDSFNSMLLSSCVKVSYEAPPGVKQNLLRTLTSWDTNYFTGHSIRCQLLFIAAWFHAILQERRTYIPQGWNKLYEFSQSDLRSTVDIIDEMCNYIQSIHSNIEIRHIQWTKLWGLLKYAIYGGRIDDTQDIRVLVTYLRKFFYSDILSDHTTPAKRKLTVVAGFMMPTSTNLIDYISAVSSLPDIDTPALFNLPDNVDVNLRQSQTQQIYLQLRTLSVSSAEHTQQSHSTTSTNNSTQLLARIQPLIILWNKLKSRNNQQSTLNKPDNEFSPIEAFVALDQSKCDKLMQLIDHTFNSIQSQLNTQSLQSIDSTLLSSCQTLASGQSPYAWTAFWNGPSDAEQYLIHASQLFYDIHILTAQQLLTQPVTLSHVFTPTSLLTALRQHTAHTMNIPIDQLKLVTSFDIKQTFIEPSISINNLLLQGCDFVDSCITPISTAQLHINLPLCRLRYVDNTINNNTTNTQATISVPLYNAPNRSQCVAELNLDCKGNIDRYVLNGVALMINTYM